MFSGMGTLIGCQFQEVAPDKQGAVKTIPSEGFGLLSAAEHPGD